MTFRILKEHPDNPYRLGRHCIPDAFPAEKEARLALPPIFEPVKESSWGEHVPVFDQGQLGSCTANAALGVLSCDPFFNAKFGTLTEVVAVKLYSLETHLDDSQVPGEFPPQDTGSTGAWSMQALQQWGWVKDYVHTRLTYTALRLLNHGPISLGVPWYSSMFTPDGTNTIHPDTSSQLAGGHQIAVIGNDVANQRVRIRNSWGAGWGDGGHAWLSWADLDLLMDSGGDVVQPTN